MRHEGHGPGCAADTTVASTAPAEQDLVVEVGRIVKWWRITATIFLTLVAVTGPPAWASSTVHHHRHRAGHRGSARRGNPSGVLYHAALLEDADTGHVLYAVNPNLQWPPASMAKMMLLLVASDEIRAGRVSYNTPVRISLRSATTRGSRLGLREGEVYP